MTLIRVLLLSLGPSCIFSQGYNSRLLSLRINEDSLVCDSPCTTLPISITFSNESNEEILTYGISDGPYAAPFSLYELCELEEIHTGLAFTLYQSDGKQKMPQVTIYDRSDRKPVTKAVLDSALRVSKKRFLSTGRIIKKNEKVPFVHELPLENLHLPAGRYYLQMVYYCGRKILNVLDEREVKIKQKKLFQGCAVSNKMLFIVK